MFMPTTEEQNSIQRATGPERGRGELGHKQPRRPLTAHTRASTKASVGSLFASDVLFAKSGTLVFVQPWLSETRA
jgi:hypothetical protein